MSISFRLAVMGALGLTALATFPSHEAEACGGFFAPREGARRPSLSYEQVLLIHDANAEKEHFIREVTFDGADSAFGFVVPTPTRPEVAKVDRSPFTALRTAFPFRVALAPRGGGIGLGATGGMGHGAGGGVQVLEVKTVGKFTAFVLKADDPAALADWLAKNKLVSTPEADRWLAHYVKMKFFYVAMRYDGAKPGEPSKLTSETVRISFDTPAPYYPYFEPDPPKGATAGPHRLLDLWLVANDPVVPVSLHTDGDTRQWVRPLRAGHVTKGPFPSTILEPALTALIPSSVSSVSVQTFADQKVSRAGYGDILFVPEAAPEDAESTKRVAKLKPMLAVLDPSLAEAP